MGRRNNKSPIRSWIIFYGPALIIILIGVGASPALYRANAGENASTLSEGDMSDKGETAYFTVEHPGVEHTLEIWPTSDPSSGDEGDADIKMVDAKGQTLLEEKIQFSTDSTGSGNTESYAWHHEKEQFTPTNAGKVTVQLISMNGKVSQVHLWVKDPKKTNGKRD